MKIKLFRAEVQILPEGGLKAWFEKRVVVTGKGETKEDKPWMPDVNKVFEQHKIWNDGRMYSLALPLLMHYAYNNNPKWWQPLCIIPVAYLVFWFATRDDQKVNRGSKDMPAPKKAKESTLAALARMEKEAREGREKEQQAYAEFEDENKVLTWNSTKETKVPIEYLKDKKHIDYHENFTYNFLARQRRYYEKGSWGYGEINNMLAKWRSYPKAWGTKQHHPYREAIKELAFVDMPNWKELIKDKVPTTPL